jgi:hypothetical protein
MGTLTRSALSIGAAVGLLTGCGGSQPPIGAPGTIPYSRAIVAHAERGGSWMLPGTSGQDLLYVSSSDGNVRAYTYPNGKLVGTLSGFTAPGGECVDAAGDVFITAFSSPTSTSSSIYEYARGGSTPIAILSDPGHALGCSIDSTSGDLAVANIYDPSNPYNIGYGSVAVYQAAQGTPTMYYPSGFGIILCGYDDKGNLYLTVSGSQPNVAQLARLVKGNSSIKPLSLSTTIYGTGEFPPFVQWDGKHMTVSSNKGFGTPVSVYHLSISGTKAKVIGTTTLESTKDRHGGQSWIDGKRIVGIAYVKGWGEVALWPYPQGGQPRREIKHILGRSQGFLAGVTVSVAPRR